jgi:radical SAM superfamily enzyme YgiQ (UPF0313 family)
MASLKYLLISPRHPQTISQNSNNVVDVLTLFPIGLAYVSAAMKRAGFDVDTINTNFIEDDLETTLKRVFSKKEYDVICTGGTSLDVKAIRRIIDLSRKVRPDIKIVVGGAIISSDAEPAMNVLQADIGVIGEGEETMCDLADALNSGSPYHRIHGVISRQKGKLVKAAPRPEIAQIDNISYMDFDGFNFSQWVKLNNNGGIIQSARSCPFKCTFCFKSTGNKYRQRSMDSIFAEIDHQIERYHIKDIGISDELFANDKNRVEEFCERIKPYHLSWGCSLRVQEIEADLLKMMHAAGCTGIGTGLESGSPRILKSMRKGVTVARLEKALEIFAESELFMLGNFIFGDLEETTETVQESLKMWEKYNQRLYINLGIVCTYPGSYIYDDACRRGIIVDREAYLERGIFDINVSKLSDEEYFDMYSTITELSYYPQTPAGKVRLIEVDDEGLCKAEWTCSRCNESYTISDIHFLQAPICRCSCGRPNTVEILRAMTCNTEMLMAEIPENEKIVFWGVGSQYCRLARFHPGCFDTDHFIQADGNKRHQLMTRLGKKIHSPEVIDEWQVKTVVITSPLARDAICGIIKSDYPSVTRVFFPHLVKVDDRHVPVFRQIQV